MQSKTTILGVIRLRNEGHSYAAIQNRYHIGSGTAQRIVSRYDDLAVPLKDLELLDSEEIERLFYPPDSKRHKGIPVPDFDSLIKKAASESSGKGYRFRILDMYEHYRAENPDGYLRTQFYEYYARFRREHFGVSDLTMGVNRVPGERVYIDYAGDKANVHIMDISLEPMNIAELQQIHLYVTTAGYSSKLYAEGFLDEKQKNFNMGTAHALEFYGAVPRYLVPDNLRTGVTRNTKDEVIINASFEDLETYYGTIVLPPPYRKPRGKATVERYVREAENKIIRALEERMTFKSLLEVNELILTEVDKINNSIPRSYSQTHNELFELYDKPAMSALPYEKYSPCDYSYCPHVPANYHVPYDNRFYSVPFRFFDKPVMLKATMDKIVICDMNNCQIAVHERSYANTLRFITNTSHMPANHQFYKDVNELTADDYLKWAHEIGYNMEKLIRRILTSSNHKEQMYRTCNSIRYMCRDVPGKIAEAAASECMRMKKVTYTDFKNTLRALNSRALRDGYENEHPDNSDDVRGKGYYA